MRRRLLAGGAIPIVDHLRSQDRVEGEAGDEAVQDELVVDFLQGREDARQRADEVVEDLQIQC